jgi:DNA-binding response OmpR family regulator
MAALTKKESHTTLLLGPCDPSTVAVVRDAAAKVGHALDIEADVGEALERMDTDDVRPVALVVCLDRPDAGAMAVAVRQRLRLSGLPIVGVARDVGELTFEEALASGIDDCCSSQSSVPLARRLGTLQDAAPLSVERRHDTVVIADADRNLRTLVGRAFLGAGYQVAFALDAADALAQALDPKVALVVVSAAINLDGDQPLTQRAAEAGSRAAWIVNTPPRDLPNVRSRLVLTGGAKVALHDAFASPPTLLFVANELIGAVGKEARESERVLFATTVAFRPAGLPGADIGYSYNFSAGGLYVGTLAPPERGSELWLELRPPRSDRWVHLEAEVVWVRAFGAGIHARVPPGFGVRITGGSQRDLESFQRSYAAFLQEQRLGRQENT